MRSSLLIAIILACIFPAVALAIAEPYVMDEDVVTLTSEDNMQDQLDCKLKVSVLTDTGAVQMELEEYICCVVLAEMPADFEPEALKAQAVVARTYTCRKREESKHSLADVCTDSSCCQAFFSPEYFLQNGGTEDALEKVRSAVYDTKGEVLFYNGELIEATYFSCSGGKTEDAQAVWGTDVPYLQSVSSPGEENATHYMDTVIFSSALFCEKLDVPLPALLDYGISGINYTNGGGVKSIVVGGITFSGTKVRKMLGLRSTAFVITWAGESVTVTTKGFGHRVGMSQYGAEAMAVAGSDYKEILYHYYQGTELSSVSG